MTANTTSENQRKRTMEALERRFASAKAEALQQMKHRKKRSLNNDEKETFTENSSAFAWSPRIIDRSVNNSPNALSKKELEQSGPTYSQLPQSIHENLLTTDVEPSSRRESTINNVLHELFQNGDSAQKYLQGSRSMKIDNWILLDNFVQGRNSGSHVKTLQTLSKRSRKHMYMKQLKKSGSLDSAKYLQKFEKYKHMHEMWKGYILQLLRTSGKNQLAPCLLTADLYGANILVAECKITAFTRVSGIMIHETAETFGIVTRDDKLYVVPKSVSVFVFRVDCWKITLLGEKLSSRNFGRVISG